jgi:hypothetical protein
MMSLDRWCHYWFYESTLNELAAQSSFSSDLEIINLALCEKVKTMLIHMTVKDTNELLASVSAVLTIVPPGKFR